MNVLTKMCLVWCNLAAAAVTLFFVDVHWLVNVFAVVNTLAVGFVIANTLRG